MSEEEEEIIPSKKTDKKLSVEKIYQKKTQLEHILLRPDSYIGSVEPCQEKMWIFDEAEDIIVNKTITFTPGLYKIFDEIIVNAADNKQRDPRMNLIKVNIEVEKNVISIWNNGKGIPVEMHKTENMYVPTLIFGHLLTSSNYDDTEKKVVGGRNGFGAKLCNIFSTKFTVETVANGKKFKQTWKNNMLKAEPEKVVDFAGTDYTIITFSPDLPKFKMEKLDDDFVALLKRRAYDIAGVARGVSVTLNGQKLKVKTFKDYVQLHLKGAALAKKTEDSLETPDLPKIVHEIVNPRWEVCITVSESGFQQCSFVNSIATSKGGTHINYLVDQICEKLIAAVKRKTGKGGFNIRPFQVKSHLWIFVNTLIENPTFDSQTKENMTLRKTAFGSTCELTERYIKNVQDCGVLESIMSWVRYKSEIQLNKKTFAQKHSKLKGIPKLDDANDAGTKHSKDCTLIITEGDSAKALAMAGLSVLGRDKYGVFPLRGKMLNVRDAAHKQIMDNAEVGHLLKIIGLQFGKKYTEDDVKSLRYGHLMIMADQDTDGSHIKGLVINFIHAHWPSLLKLDFLEEFITPIVKVTKGKECLSFFSLPEFEEWKEFTSNHKSWRVKYYKGLGTSTSKEGKEYFSDMARHRITFEYDGPSSDQAIVMAFSKKCINERKNWLTQGMEERRLRKESGLPVVYLYEKHTKSVTYRDFVNKELILFSNADNERSIPSLVDGLKPGQRKVLFTCMKRNDKTEVKVAQLAGSVAEMSAYHHGEASLMGTIVGLAQNFVGSNNLNLLVPCGQFGTRTLGGKDSASPRYIFTKMSILTRHIFPAHDDYVLAFLYEDNLRIEPEWYCPIIPMVLVNGAEGIGTGWATKIPNYDVRQLAEILRKIIAGEEPTMIDLVPSYKNYKGDIEKVDSNRYMSYGVISIIDETTIEISELPIKIWTQCYKESVMDVLLYGTEKTKPQITDYKEHHTDTTVRFVVTMTPEQLAKAEHEGLHKLFKLDTSFTTSSMVLFDEYGCLKKFDTVYDIIINYQKVRLLKYQERRLFLIGMLEAECSRLENQARFILEKIEGKITIENRTRRDIMTHLVERGFQSDPVKSWRASIEAEADDDDEDDRTNAASSVSSVGGGPDFQYLLTLPIMSLSREKKEELLSQRDDKKEELELLRSKSPEDLWLDELDAFLEELDRVEEEERIDDQASAAIKKTVDKNRGKKGRGVTKPPPTQTGTIVKPIKPPSKESRRKTKTPGKPKEEVVENGEVPSATDHKKKNGSVSKKPATPKATPKQKRKRYASDSAGSEDSFQPETARGEEFAGAPTRSLRQKAAMKYADDSDENDVNDDDGMDQSGSEQSDDDAAILPPDDLEENNGTDDDAAETLALIEKLSPMKTAKGPAKPIPKSKLAVGDDSQPTDSDDDTIKLSDLSVKITPVSSKPPKKTGREKSSAKDDDIWGKSSTKDDDIWGKSSNKDDDIWGKSSSKDDDIWGNSSVKDDDIWGKSSTKDGDDMWVLTEDDENDKDSDVDSAVKKIVAEEDTPKKPAAKKTASKKTAPKKDTSKKDTPKKDALKKDASKKDTPKKDAPKKTAPKKPVSKTVTPKKDDNLDDGDAGDIQFSIDGDADVKEKTPAPKRPRPKKDKSEADDKEPSKKKSRAKATPKTNTPKPKKKPKKFDNSDDESGSDFEAKLELEPVFSGGRDRTGRAAAAAKTKYKFTTSEEEDNSDFC